MLLVPEVLKQALWEIYGLLLNSESSLHRNWNNSVTSKSVLLATYKYHTCILLQTCRVFFKKKFSLQPYPYSSSPAVLLKQQVPIGYQPTYNYQVCQVLLEAERLLDTWLSWNEVLTGVWSLCFSFFGIYLPSLLHSYQSKNKIVVKIVE